MGTAHTLYRVSFPSSSVAQVSFMRCLTISKHEKVESSLLFQDLIINQWIILVLVLPRMSTRDFSGEKSSPRCPYQQPRIVISSANTVWPVFCLAQYKI